MGKIYNLSYETVIQNGHSIVFKQKNEQPLKAEDINSPQLKMVQSNRVPHFLPISIENVDTAIRLHYNIASKQRVIPFFRSINATMTHYYQLFISIIETLQNSTSNMLYEHFVLHPDFIFIGNNASDVYLTYLPIDDLRRNTSVTDELKNLLTIVAGEVSQLQGNEFKKILNYMKNESFNLQGLRELLFTLMPKQNVAKPLHSVGTHEIDNNLVAGKKPVNHQPIQQKEVVVQKQHHIVQKKNEQQKVKGKLPPLTSKAKVYLFAGALLAIAIIWKLYTMNPTEEMLMISAGASLFVLICVFILLKVWRPGVKRIETEPKELNQQNSEAPQAKQQPVQGTPKESRKQLEWNTMAQVNQQNHHVTAQPIQHEPLPPQQHHDFQQHDHQVVQDTIPSQHQERQQPVHPIGQESIHENQLQHVSESLSQNPSKTINQHATPIQTQREIVQPLPSQETNVAQKEEVKQATSQAQMSPAIAATSMDTALLDDESDDTVLLDESFYGEEEIRPILIRETEDGTVSEIIVDSDQFMIGRNSDLANYLEDTIGVSRKHAEIVKIDEDTYGLKDLDSKNGTRVNGKALVPLKVYELNDGDKFRIGKVDYTFKWETKE